MEVPEIHHSVIELPASMEEYPFWEKQTQYLVVFTEELEWESRCCESETRPFLPSFSFSFPGL